MKFKHLFLAAALLIGSCPGVSAVNITPTPAEMTVGTGSLKLPQKIKIGFSADLPENMKSELNSIGSFLKESAGIDATVKKGKGLFNIVYDASIPEEGYSLDITKKSATIKASSPAGLFYAFQSMKQLLPPATVLAKKGVYDPSFSLPEIQISDSPRFPYRGFMLDVSRHFYDVDQIKKMIDVMAAYKLNRFHWHLTDDHGWRLPMDKYPELTEKGATAHHVLHSDFENQTQWRDDPSTSYGPFAYTKEELKDVVEYAKKRHIEILPEVDMPGHMVAAIHAYPEFSTDPQSRLVPDSVAMDSDPVANQPMSHFTHNIWNSGGVSRDVLDVSNPKVMDFAKEVVDVLADVFPYDYIHIGGDECPTLAWELSKSCQNLKQNLGLSDFRELQAWFTNQIADYAAEKHGKKIMGWNELVTDKGVDMNTIKRISPVIMCWVGADQAAQISQQNGLNHIYTPWDKGYYINRSYKGFDKIGAGRDGSIEQTYKTVPPDNDLCVGVQGTFWCEQVDRPEDLEYLALPRLIAISEHGWSPADKKNFDDFMKRLDNNARILEEGGYNFARHQLKK